MCELPNTYTDKTIQHSYQKEQGCGSNSSSSSISDATIHMVVWDAATMHHECGSGVSSTDHPVATVRATM
eukprot:365059-Chlamydomonas_euryale.AAC.11